MIDIVKDRNGHVIGRKLDNGMLLDGKGRLTARFLSGANVTLNSKGRLEGRGDQTLRLLNDNKHEK